MTANPSQTTPSRVSSAHASFCIVWSANDSAVLQKAASILGRQITTRCAALAVTEDRTALRIILSVQNDMAAEAYRIESGGEREVRIFGGSERGVLYGAGKFLRTSRYDQGGFTPSTWRGESAPQCSFRAMYLASHFGNFYEAAPRDEVNRYVQDLGLWGYNTIAIYYPTDQFTGPDDPASVAWFAQFKAVLAEVKACGLQIGLGIVPNHCFKPAPPELAFTKMSGQSNHGEGVCTSKPAGRSLVLRNCRWLMDQFREVGVDSVFFGPYDDGGCGCPDCWPWGSRGYLSIAREFVTHIRAVYPMCRVVLHTWCFESENDARPLGEWEGLAASLERDKSWVDYIMADGHDDYFPSYPLEVGAPGGLPLINFPEISMFGAFPWGGYGTNSAPAHFQKLWDRIKRVMSGGMPYSEGIYEDINKAIVAGFYWDKERSAEDTVREYAAFEFGPDVADALLEMVRLFEGNHNRHFIKASAMQAFAIAQKVDTTLTEQARRAWRWRIVYLRALIDKEMHAHPNEMSEALKDAFRELTRIYHAEHANERVKPLTGRLNSVGQLSARHSPFVKTWHMSKLQPPADLASTGPVTLGDALGWREFVVPWFITENDFVCVHDLFGAQDGLVYLANRFTVEQTGEWILHLGHDGGAKMFVDGREILCEPTRVNPAPKTRSQARVRLEPGAHEIVIAFDTDQGNGWGIYFCFERPEGVLGTNPFPQRWRAHE